MNKLNCRTGFLICTILISTMAILVCIAIWLYRNRKVNYRMGNEANCEYRISVN